VLSPSSGDGPLIMAEHSPEIYDSKSYASLNVNFFCMDS
jgi:hypothetical protein